LNSSEIAESEEGTTEEAYCEEEERGIEHKERKRNNKEMCVVNSCILLVFSFLCGGRRWYERGRGGKERHRTTLASGKIDEEGPKGEEGKRKIDEIKDSAGLHKR
jgi:hypothetical protein